MQSENCPRGIDEPLLESAPLAWHLAPRLCPAPTAEAETCVWYHRVWQYLRLLQLISTVETNDAFFDAVFRRLAPVSPRVLVSGTADYGVLARVRHAYGSRRLSATVVDRCGTAIALNQWYADRAGLAIATHTADMLAVEGHGLFDLVCTHNFLSRFDDVSRARLVRRWYDLLRPGGYVVTTQRVSPGALHHRNQFLEVECRALGARAAEAARSSRTPIGVAPEELGEAVVEYARRKGGYVIASIDSVTRLFERAGFAIEVADEGAAHERLRDRPSTAHESRSFRMRLLAYKRE